ncbi:unnamed protein product [Ilex paraguariensis]|uniref:Uncharacterized protein n=1 Tax=Ilex paraguariensis TaxID=185542 RepID=A0ABC8T8K3_9AQUA
MPWLGLQFEALAIDKYLMRVSHIEARSEQYDMYMQLDVNIEIYRMHVGEKFMMVLASILNLDGTPDSDYYTQVVLLVLQFVLYALL